MDDFDDKEYSDRSYKLTHCPVFLEGVDGDITQCGASLEVTVYITTTSDKYGSWDTYQVAFPCNHTLQEMESALAHGEYV